MRFWPPVFPSPNKVPGIYALSPQGQEGKRSLDSSSEMETERRRARAVKSPNIVPAAIPSGSAPGAELP